MNTPFAILHLSEVGRIRSYLLNGMPATLGRSPENSVVLEGAGIAAEHARLMWIKEVPHLVDLGSQSGTTLKGARLVPERPYPLAADEVATLGSYRLKVEVNPPLNLAALDKDGRRLPAVRAAQLAFARPAKFHLMVATAGDYKKFELQAETLTIGRDPASDIHVDHEAISGQHARLTRTPRGYEIVDLNSANGLDLSGRRISRKLLANGDVITVAGRRSRQPDLRHHDPGGRRAPWR